MEHLWFRDIDLSEDGERLLVGIGRKGIYLWDLAARRLRRPPLELPDLLDVTGPADGPRLALLTTQHEIRILSWPSGELERSWKVPGVEVAELLLSPDGENLAAGLDDGRILLWDLSGSSPLPGPRTPPRPAGR